MMEYDWQTIIGHCPSIEEWYKIPGISNKYELSTTGRVRAFYKYRGHVIDPHYTILNTSDGRVRVGRDRYSITRLMSLVFGDSHVEDLDKEEWKDVFGYEGLYRISNLGRIKSAAHNEVRKNGVTQFYKEQIIKFTIMNSGYYIVHLYRDKKMTSFLVHRLVAKHFLDNPCCYNEVNHKNENKLDNRVDNLEWCSRTYNQNYGTSQVRRIATRLANNGGYYGYRRKSNRYSCVQE